MLSFQFQVLPRILKLEFSDVMGKQKNKNASFLYTNEYNKENLLVCKEPEPSLFPANVHIPKSDSQSVRKRKRLLSCLDKTTTSFRLSSLYKAPSLPSFLPFTLPSAHSCRQTLISSSLSFMKSNVRDSEGHLIDWLLLLIKPNIRPFIFLTIHDILRGFSGIV